MNKVRHQAECSPACRLVVDEAPPLGTKIWLITEWGTGVPGAWYPECHAIAWAPLPKLTPEQKARIEALRAEGVNLTQPPNRRAKPDDRDQSRPCCAPDSKT